MTTDETTSAPVIASSTMKAKKGRRPELLQLLTELAHAMIYPETGCTHYSVHRALGDDEDGPILIVQAYISLAAFREHGAKIRTQVPRLAELLDGALTPPVLFEQVVLGGPPAKELFSGR